MSQPDPWLEHYGEHRRPPRRLRRLGAALGVAALVAIAGLSVFLLVHRNDPWRPPSGAGGFHDCTYGDRLDARCASVRVPEDPGRPQGRQVALHVAIIPATRQPARGALFYLEGGPGGAASARAVSVNEIFAKVSEYRDIVLLDQRGTGGSRALSCPQQHVSATDASAVTAYLRSCFAKLGDATRFLTSAVAAADLEHVRRALGYARIDVYGSSYGATLAQLFAQRYPQAVRTLTLDGASLPDVPVYELTARNAERALRAEIARCQALPACRQTYRDTREELQSVLERGTAGAFNGLATAIAVLLRTPETAAGVPLLIHQAAEGDLAPLKRAYAEHVGRELDARSRLALFWMTLCGERWARFDVDATERASAGTFLAAATAERARLFQQACRAVPHATPAMDAKAWSTPVPVLLLAGAADPQDPPGNLRGWRAHFPNGRLIAVPGLGHGVIAYGCLRLLEARFIAMGSARGLDARCASRIPLPRVELS